MLSRQMRFRQIAAIFTARSPVHIFIHTTETKTKSKKKQRRLRIESVVSKMCHHGTRRTGSDKDKPNKTRRISRGQCWRMLFAAPHG
ncbi:hypothetical protein BRADI_1g64295v3 [Brachypodium distachyon]|uniref:Uncharacterized protein n=1 Tax=Brachypodium distachyon TaxID=15368 RepID=A0A0Q3NWP2_BRADI|nr:hypothetical protein BRADI_1g64295v3 [Brachypodium distachyon]